MAAVEGVAVAAAAAVVVRVAAVAVTQAVVVAARAGAVARIAVVPAAEAVAVVARIVVAAAGAAVVAATPAARVVAIKTAIVNLGIALVITARGIRVATATIVVIARTRPAKEIASWFVSRNFRGTETATVIVTEIVIVAVIGIVIETEIVIVTETGIASTKALAFTIRRIMVGTGTAPTLTSRATETACSRGPTMAAGGRTMTLSVLTSTGAGLLVDCSPYLPTGFTSKLTGTALCAVIRRAIRTGSGTLWAGVFVVSWLHTGQIPKVYPAR